MWALRPDDPAEIGGFPLLARIGEGGMGEVFLGLSPGGMHVAVKVIGRSFTDPQAGARFRREVETARHVRSRFAAALVGAGVQDPPYWLATEYIPGPTLKQAVQHHGPLPPGTCLRLAAALAECLADLHRQGVRHRDLKPANVILGKDGPSLIDFGIARGEGQEQITRTGTWTGTPGFVAPEVIDGHSATAASDVFSLAGTLAYAATGRPPFGADSAEAIVHRTLAGALDLAGVDARLAALLDRCAAKDPADRPAPDEIMRLCAVREPLAEHPDYRRLVALTVAPPADLRAAVAGGLVPPDHGRTAVATAPPPRSRRRMAMVLGGTGVVAATAALLVFQGLPGTGAAGGDGTGHGGTHATATTGGSPPGAATAAGTPAPSGTARTTPTSTPTKTTIPNAPTIKSIDRYVGSYEWNPATGKCDKGDKRVKDSAQPRLAHTPAVVRADASVDLKLLYEWYPPSGQYIAAQIRPPTDPPLGGNRITGIVNTKPKPYVFKGDRRNQFTFDEALTVTYPEDFSWRGSNSESFSLSAGAWTVVWYNVPANGRAVPIACTGFTVT